MQVNSSNQSSNQVDQILKINDKFKSALRSIAEKQKLGSVSLFKKPKDVPRP